MLEDAAQEDLDEKAIKLRTGLGTSLAQGRCKQCLEAASHMAGTGKVVVYKRKDGNWDGRIPPPKPEMPEVTSKQESTMTTRITAQGGSRGSVSHKDKNEAARTMDTIT